MLKSNVRTCDVTRRRMPQSFMIRFVSSSAQAGLESKPNFTNLTPNLSSDDKMHHYVYCFAS